jgi:DnaJ family protein C protein 3
MKNMQKAKTYCPQVPDSLHGLLYTAQTQLDAESYEAAIQTLTTARDNYPESQETVNTRLHDAQVLLKRSKTKDYYAILSVPRDADDRTIKKAYRTATKLYHPDKASAKGVPKEEAERKMAAINEAYEVLSDPELKARFDRGEDPNDPTAQQGGNPFQGSPFSGFGGQGGQQFFFQQGGGGGGGGGQRQFKFSQQGGGNPFGGFPGFG